MQAREKVAGVIGVFAVYGAVTTGIGWILPLVVLLGNIMVSKSDLPIGFRGIEIVIMLLVMMATTTFVISVPIA